MLASLDQSAAERARRAAAADGAKCLLFGHSVIGALACVCVCVCVRALVVFDCYATRCKKSRSP